jgi:hypothetical protein
VTVPAGEHRVRLRYSPPGSRVGLLVTLGTAIGTLVLAVARQTPRLVEDRSAVISAPAWRPRPAGTTDDSRRTWSRSCGPRRPS